MYFFDSWSKADAHFNGAVMNADNKLSGTSHEHSECDS